MNLEKKAPVIRAFVGGMCIINFIYLFGEGVFLLGSFMLLISLWLGYIAWRAI